MTERPADPTPAWSFTRWVVRIAERGQVLAVVVVLLLTGLRFGLDPAPVETLRLKAFDVYQRLSPRIYDAQPVLIAAIDESSLERLGQWPWPRSMIGELVTILKDAGALSVGVDVIFPESDRMSPHAMAARLQDTNPDVAEALRSEPDTDTVLQQAISQASTTLAVVGLEGDDGDPGLTAVPIGLGGDVDISEVPRFETVLTSLPTIQIGASGQGVINPTPEVDPIIRRLPGLARIGDQTVPGLAVDMFRQVLGAPFLSVVGDDNGPRTVEAAGYVIPVDGTGAIRVRFTRTDPNRYVSAADLLEGIVDPSIFAGRFALVGVTAIGLEPYPTTPLGETMPGVEVHAQLIETLFEEAYLTRPFWADAAEGGLIILLAGLVLLLVPRLNPKWGASFVFAVLVGLPLIGYGAYVRFSLLLDPTAPFVTLGAMALVLGIASLIAADHRQRQLERALAEEREAAAKVAGELAAAQRIQSGLLPDPSEVLAGDARVDVAARLDPAREVGGDLYDCFFLDESTLVFLVGDVSGKGVPASLFMAITKALTKSSALRKGGVIGGGDLGLAITIANEEISRDNPEMLFVTAMAGLLNLETGELALVNAGHDAPLCRRTDGTVVPLETLGGPALCMLEDFEYDYETVTLNPGDLIILYTDGVTEAFDVDENLFGSERLLAAFSGLSDDRIVAEGAVDHVFKAVRSFAEGAPQSDDITVMALRWKPEAA